MAERLPDIEEGKLAFTSVMPDDLRKAWDAAIPKASADAGVPYLEWLFEVRPRGKARGDGVPNPFVDLVRKATPHPASPDGIIIAVDTTQGLGDVGVIVARNSEGTLTVLEDRSGPYTDLDDVRSTIAVLDAMFGNVTMLVWQGEGAPK